MKITDKHWKVFELKMQDRLTWSSISQEMGIPVEEAKELHKELKANQPDLYPCETELAEFKRQHMTRSGHKLVSINNIDESKIVRKW